MISTSKLIPILIALAPLPAFANIQYWSHSDSCDGAPDGIIEVVGSSSDVAGCVALGGSGQVWSIKVDGSCINVSDTNCKPIFH